ncbi:aliphatic sulfonate ABC transporter substrate-binding protein [Pseudomonas sp. PA27(2017)]|uniref:aliphatic sulfonate ABC transporter substrate-binding protein n=1 Tax=Pseudomonas sp. PA27(2017) TaxID=1932112 RepID=UPI000967A72C|nr:aliphatic sulfonate ABC transporter substrate-binding protein [Pseudomonas sp. PA27(2017)]OLU33475.1 nitrate ABC transporter substrate-binding protein [Pseudomonas sp. PA27(2017)]
MKIRTGLSALLLSTLSLAVSAAELTIGDQRGNARAVMEAAGVLDGLDYQIQWREFPNAAPLLEALRAGHLDGGLVGEAPLTFAAAAGLEAKAIQAASYLGNALIIGGNAGIVSVADLKGKKIAAVKGSSGQALALNALARVGLKPGDVTFVNTTPSEATLALSNGSVDAVATWEPYVSFAVQQSGAKILADGKDYPSLNYLVAANTALQSKSAELEDFSARLAQARVWGAAHPEPYAKAIASLLKLPQAVVLGKVQREVNTPQTDLAAVRALQQATIDLYQREGLIPRSFPADSVIEASFFAERAP